MVVRRLALLTFLFALAASSCLTDKTAEFPGDALFRLVPGASSGIDFVNQITNEKDLNIFLYRNFYNGGGVGIGDINNDGLPDVYLIANMGKNRLFLNLGGFKFQDITEKSGAAGEHAWSTGVVMADINADGLLDIYVCNAGNVKGDFPENELFINNGDLTFTDRAAAYGLADEGFTTHAAFFDYDADGDLDVYILNNSFIPVSSLGYSNQRMVRSEDWNVPDLVKGGGDKLLRNDGGKYKDVSEEAGIYGSLIGFGMGVTVGDINMDNRPDIYISNDFYERDYLYINQGDGTFRENIKEGMAHLSLASMGADMADINNDGYSEVYVTDMLPEGDARLKNTTEFDRYDIYQLKLRDGFYHQLIQNTLQLNHGNGTYSEIAFYSGVAETDWSWGPLIFDMDNDGFLDIFVANGIYHDLTNQDFIDYFASEIIQQMTVFGRKEVVDTIINRMPSTPIPNYAFRNQGDLTFKNMASEWGFGTPSFSNGSAYGDLDNDGDLDLIVNNVNQPCFIYQNRADELTGNHYLRVKLQGSNKNTLGIGSTVNVYFGGQIHKQELIPSRGFQSSVSHVLNFGTGKHSIIDSVEVIWPGGRRQVFYQVDADTLITFHIHDADKQEVFSKGRGKAAGKTIGLASPFGPHVENFYLDFDHEGLIIEILSREGPAMDVGDVTGDGLDDVFMGGASNEPGKIYVQSAGGQMTIRPSECFEKDRAKEDTYARFLDADGDGDLDLYVGSGGNDKESNSGLLRDRLYINDGKGSYQKADAAIPDFRYNTAVVAPCDFDRDGDLDLFAGSLSVSRIYGINPKHFLLENNGAGQYTDITEARAYKFRHMGMVTDAAWEDMDKDGWKDLIVVGHWMAPTIFKNSGSRLSPEGSSLDSLTGWWNAVSVLDLDDDGYPDLVLGNRGRNSNVRVSPAAPVKMYVNDFDNDGRIEQILTRYIKGMDKPLLLKREISAQIPSLGLQDLTFSDYAEKSIYDLFPEGVIDNSIVRDVIVSESMMAYRTGENQYRTEPLPGEIQFSCVNVILAADVNEDGRTDLVLGENNYGFKPQFGRLDAGFAHLITGSENGFGKAERIGMPGQGVVNSIREIILNDQKYIILGINDAKPIMFKISP